MAPSIKAELLQSVAPLGSFLECDFYMATFREGKVQKVINMMGGPPRRVRRVLDFDSKREIEKEEALARKRKELGLASDFEVHPGEKETTLADMLLEMRQRKSAGVVATVQRKKLAPKKKVKKAVPARNVEGVISMDEVAEAVDEEIHVVSLQETVPVEEVAHVEDAVPVEASPPRKKRKRKSTSIIHPCSKLLDTEEDSQGDDLTLAEYMKKSASTTGRASSDNAGIKVFQRRKVKFKAVRRRTSKVGDQQSSSILVCDDLCECEVCGPSPPKTAEANAVNLEQPSINQTSHPDSCTGEFESLTLPDDLHQLPVRHCGPPMDEADDFQELTEEQFRVEVGQQMPSVGQQLANTGEVSDLSCPENSCAGRYDEYLDPPNDGPGVSEVLDAESRPKISEEMGGDGGQARCSLNTESSSFCFATPHENAASVVSPMQLDFAVDRIESILDTLVTPDDLLPTHLTSSASKSSRKKKKRRRFSESLSDASLGEVSEVENQRQEENLAKPTPPTALPGNAPSSGSEEVASIESSGIIGQQISEQIAGHISEQICELLSQEVGSAHEPTVRLLSEGKATPADCAVDVEIVGSSSIEDAEECSVNDNNAVPEDVVKTPTISSSCDEGSPERDEIVGGTSTSKALFSNLKADCFNKRNRKSFSPKSQKAFLAALKPERSTPSMKIKVMKSKLGERCSSVLFSHEIVGDKPDCPEEVVADKSGCSEEVVADKPDCPEELVADKSDCPEEVVADIFGCSEEVVADKSSCAEEVVADKSDCPEEQHPSPDDSFAQDLLQCDVEQTEFYASIDSQPLSPPPLTSEEAFISSVLLSTPEPPSDGNTTDIVPGSPEYKKEPFVSREGSDGICTPDRSGIRLLPCTEGSLHIDVECHPETPLSDLKTPNDKIEPASQQPKSILKSAGSETCRGICTCPRCVSTCDQSRTARKFIRSQVVLADVVANKLLDELRNLRTLVEEASPCREGDGTTLSRSQTKGALESASKTEDWAKKEMLKMSRDSKRVCRLIDVGPRRTIFADDAGHRLCHVKLLPAKKTLSKDSLLPSKIL